MQKHLVRDLEHKLGNQLIIKEGAVIKIEESSVIEVLKGRLVINQKWIEEDPFPFMLAMGNSSQLIVNNNFDLFSGSRISINDNATLTLGSGFINHNLNLACFCNIEIGYNAAISENVTIRDSDNHTLLPVNKPIAQPIKIGNHVWIGMNVTILKGVTIGDGAVIAAGSLVNKDIPERCLAGGVPAKVLKTDIDWRL